MVLPTFLVLNFRLDILDAVRWFHLERDGLPGQGFDEDLHSSPETQNQMKSGLFLDVVVGERTTIFQLLASKDQPLLVWRDSCKMKKELNSGWGKLKMFLAVFSSF